MESGYKMLWTDNALNELSATYEYLEANYSDKTLKELSTEIDKILELIVQNPRLFPLVINQEIRKVVIKKYNTIYYQLNFDTIEILSFFSNRKDPDKKPF